MFNNLKKKNKPEYEIDDLSYIQEMAHSKLGNWEQYDVLLAARGYGWDTILDWADYMAQEDVDNISKAAFSVMPGMGEKDFLSEYKQSGSFSQTGVLKNEYGLLTIGGMSKRLRAPVQIIWLNQTRSLRFFTIVKDEVLMTRYIETMIRKTFNTPDEMKLAKPIGM